MTGVPQTLSFRRGMYINANGSPMGGTPFGHVAGAPPANKDSAWLLAWRSEADAATFVHQS
mgnify:FL=1